MGVRLPSGRPPAGIDGDAVEGLVDAALGDGQSMTAAFVMTWKGRVTGVPVTRLVSAVAYDLIFEAFRRGSIAGCPPAPLAKANGFRGNVQSGEFSALSAANPLRTALRAGQPKAQAPSISTKRRKLHSQPSLVPLAISGIWIPTWRTVSRVPLGICSSR